jgi:hypothetical protein
LKRASTMCFTTAPLPPPAAAILAGCFARSRPLLSFLSFFPFFLSPALLSARGRGSVCVLACFGVCCNARLASLSATARFNQQEWIARVGACAGRVGAVFLVGNLFLGAILVGNWMAQTTDAPPAPHMCGTRCIITLSTHLLRSSLPARLRNIIQPLGSCGAGDPGGTVGSCVDRQRASLGELPARSGDGEAPRGACYFFILRIFLKKLLFRFFTRSLCLYCL